MKDYFLLDDFYCVLWALGFTGSADEAFVDIYGIRFFIFNLEYFNWAYIDAGPASGTLIMINFNFHHII